MHDDAHVSFVDAHAERIGRDDDANLLLHECVLHVLAPLIVEASVIGFGRDARSIEVLRDTVYRLARRGIDDGDSSMPFEQRDECAVFLRVVLRAHNMPSQIAAIKTGEHQRWRAECEHLRDVASNFWRRGRRQGDRGRSAESRVNLAHSPVTRPEVVAPLRNAVGLVHRQQRHLHRRNPVAGAAQVESFGRDVQQFQLPTLRAREAVADLGRGERAVNECGGNALQRHRVHLILHQRNKRREHDGEPFEHHCGHLITERLASASGEDHERVVSGEHGLDCTFLARPELCVAKALAKYGARLVDQG